MWPKVSRHLAEFFSWGLRQPLCENPQRSATTPRIFSVGFLGRSQKPLAICPDTFGLISKRSAPFPGRPHQLRLFKGFRWGASHGSHAYLFVHIAIEMLYVIRERGKNYTFIDFSL